ncbi:tautomerase family protein [Spongiimicrobium salis]|uniref:tautomerase family protein n=1 Tax=Spongiimicrobium salis TaxID=1667022 RepID=UPI00374D7F32
MPTIKISTPKGILTEKIKNEIHKGITDVMIKTEGRGNKDFAQFVTIIIDEQDPANWSIGGNVVTPEIIENLSSS